MGTSTAAEAREYFAQLDKHKIQFEWDDGCESLIDLAFNKDRAEDRKTWLLEVSAPHRAGRQEEQAGGVGRENREGEQGGSRQGSREGEQGEEQCQRVCYVQREH